MIPQRAEQEFCDELDECMANQPAEWHVLAADQKELMVSASDFAYYVKIRQQHIDRLEIVEFDVDLSGLPIVFFRGIRIKPFLT